MARSAGFVPEDCLYFEECGRGAWSKGMCLMHYKRVWRGGVAARPQKIPNGKSLEYAMEFHGWTVTESGCWEWNGPRSNSGYGFVYHAGETLIASRVAYRLWKGEEPGDLYVCHTCDNPPCINPDHLWLGTNADNMRDMAEKGRADKKPGELTHNAKLNADAVRDIRTRRNGGEGLESIAADYGVTGSCVWSVANGKSWKHVE